MKRQFVVIFGRIDVGVQTVHGPFASAELAEQWIRGSGNQEHPHIVRMLSIVHEQWNHLG